MAANIGRLILGILAGLVVAWLSIALCEFASVYLHRPQPGVDLRDPQALSAYIDAAPFHARRSSVAGWRHGSRGTGARPHSLLLRSWCWAWLPTT